ncbi:MAG: H(+)/Cl(-) exchange transporter ClcA [Acidimicrobiales bacterium]
MQLSTVGIRHRAGTLRLVIVASVAGAVTGLVSETFGLLVRDVSRARTDFIHWAHDVGSWSVCLVLCAASLCAAAGAWLVHRVEPHAEGSGIPRVEAVVEGRAEPGRLRIVPVKYVGGLLAIGGGLALGREGPLVQMGGVIGAQCARLTRMTTQDMRMIVAGGAAAGLATAFNAPIAGGVFVLEELFKRFDPRATVSTLSASAAGFAATHLLVADHTDFTVPRLPEPSLRQAPLCLIVGVLCGVLGVAYNKAVLAGLMIGDRSTISAPLRALGIGAVVGAVAWLSPNWVGTGDNLTQAALTGGGVLSTVVLIFLVRFALGVVSYSANAPGGLFAPMLVLGSHAGLAVGLAITELTRLPAGTTAALALVGLASFFTASVQAPVTGIILASEMTGSVTWLPPMLGAVAIAMVLAMLMGSEPIYDALTTRAARNVRMNQAEEARSKPGNR